MTDNDERFAEKIGEALRTRHQFSPDYTDRVMSAIAADTERTRPAAVRAERRAGMLAWLTLPRPFAISPLAVAASAVIVALLGFGAAQTLASSSDGSIVRTASAPVTLKNERDTVRLVQFVFVAQDAKSVAIVGDFNNWDTNATHLVREGDQGLWTTSIPLPHGRHQYAFVVDGKRWMVDPSAPTAVENSYGTPNSVVTVTADAL